MKLTKMLFVAALATSGTDVAANDDILVPQEGASVAYLSLPNEPCPMAFFQLPLYPQARLCQIFADQLPASLTYHADTDQQSVQEFYEQQLGPPESESILKGRIVLQYRSAERIIIISNDGDGTQIDILVKTSD